MMKRISKTGFFTFLLFIISFGVYSQVPQITQHPLSGEKCTGNSVSFSVEATGASPLHYQWYFENNPVGTDSPILAISSVNQSNEGVYYCIVTNLSGSATSNDAILLVAGGAPVIDNYSSDTIMCQGELLLLSVEVTADYESYSWFRQGSGFVEYGQTLDIENITSENSGLYYCEISNVCGSVSTGNITVQVNDAPQFVSLPSSVEICEGNDVSFTAEASGTNIQYAWLADNVEMPGETENTLIIAGVVYPDYTFYVPVAYNICDTIYGPAVSVSVLSNPVITGNPISQDLCDGEDFQLIATANSNIALTYQWYRNEDLITGETGDSYNGIAEEGVIDSYYCIITNQCIWISTDTAIITGLESPVITQQPEDVLACAGEYVTLHCKASGSEPLYYQWLFNGANVTGGNITGANSETLQFNEITEGQAGDYTCFVYNDCGSTLTEIATVTVNLPPVILMQPDDIEVCAGQDFEVAIMVSGTNPLTYDWTNFETGVSFGTSEELVLTDIAAEMSGLYICTVSNMCGDAESQTFQIMVNTLPEVLGLSENMSVCEDDSVALIVAASGTEPIDYLWYRNGSAESWATNDTIIFNPAQFGNTGTYFCRMYNLCGQTDSDPVELYVGTPPSIQWNTGTQYLCEWDTLNLVVDPAGEFVAFQWYFNDVIIDGATDSVYNVPNITPGMTGMYTCRVYNSCDEIFTSEIEVNINPAPEVDLGDDIETCEGISVVLHPEGDFQSYTWNDGLSSGPQLDVEISGTYWVVVVGQNACSNRDTIHVEIHPVIEVDFGNDVSACGEYLLTAPEGAYSYQWSTGASGVNEILVTESGPYTVTTTGDSFGCQSVGYIEIEIFEIPVFNLGPDHIIANDSAITVGVETEYADYIWYNGFNGPMLTVSGADLGTGEHDIWLRVMSENGCNFTDSIVVSVFDASGIENLGFGGLTVCPNPASGLIFVSADDAITGQALLEIYDTRLNIVYSDKQNLYPMWQRAIDISNLSPGVYFIHVLFDSGKRVTKKISIF